MALQFRDMDPREPIFTHVDTDTGVTTHMASTRMARRAEVELLAGRIQGALIPIDDSFVEFCLSHRGIEQHRLQRLERHHLLSPMTFCVWQDGSHLLVDGSHRYVRHKHFGMKRGRALILPAEVWREYVIEGGEQVTDLDALVNSFSGIF